MSRVNDQGAGKMRADGVNYHLPDRGRGIGSRDSFLGFVKVLGFLRPACAFQRLRGCSSGADREGARVGRAGVELADGPS